VLAAIHGSPVISVHVGIGKEVGKGKSPEEKKIGSCHDYFEYYIVKKKKGSPRERRGCRGPTPFSYPLLDRSQGEGGRREGPEGGGEAHLVLYPRDFISTMSRIGERTEGTKSDAFRSCATKSSRKKKKKKGGRWKNPVSTAGSKGKKAGKGGRKERVSITWKLGKGKKRRKRMESTTYTS